MITLPRLRGAGLAVLAVAAAVLSFPATASAGALPTATPGTTRVTEARDWASENLADPFDFANAEDLQPASTDGLGFPNVAGGTLNFAATSGGFFQPVRSLGSIPHGRDSDQFPVVASTYSRLSFRMWSGASAPQAGGITWFTCWGQVPSCGSARSFTLLPGWNTYDLDMTQPPDLMNNTGGWSGAITSIRVTPTGSTASAFLAKVDWLRIYQPTAPVTVSVAGGSGSEVWCDSDADPSNNDTSSASGGSAGRVATNVGPGGTVAFNAAAFPPGTYRFFTRSGGQDGAYSAPLTISPRPEPQLLSPSLATGDDYATTVRGDAWDFSQSTDAASVANFVPSFGGGVMTGTAAGSYGDPQFFLPTAGVVDATMWHKLTFRISYDGPMGLADAPGGGMVMRLIWGVDNGLGGISWHDGRDIVVTPGWQTVSVDLKSDPPSLTEDETSTNPIGWGGPASQRIRYVRFDPHEDPGGRTWRIDDVKLTRNDRAAPAYTFSFRDAAWQPGTTAEVWLDRDRGGFDGTRVASGVAVAQGTNSVTWNAKGSAPGTYWPYLVLRSADGTVSRSYATGALDVDVPYGTPLGAIDAADAPPGRIHVAGWTLDPDTGVDQPIDVHLYVDGAFAGATTANLPRADVAAAVPGWGSRHGFDLSVAAAGGTHTVCAYAINVGPGGNPLLGCRAVTVRSGSPFGSLDAARPAPLGTIDLAGWSIDPDTAASTDVHVYVNGAFAGATTANGRRADVAAAFPGYGPAHGYGLRVKAQGGVNTVCAYGINRGAGGNSLLGCGRVVVPVDPVGSLDTVRRNADGTVTVAGWALDPESAQSIQVHVYLGNAGYPLTAARSRPDVAAAYPGNGDRHGFSATLPAARGPLFVCAYGINQPGTAGGNSVIGCGVV